MSDEINGAAAPQPSAGSNMAPAPTGETEARSGDGRTLAAENSADGNDAQVMLPLVDVVEDAGGITLYADLPGVPKENLTLHLEFNN
jgi:HSP20 family molecular chaperone IbpA